MKKTTILAMAIGLGLAFTPKAQAWFLFLDGSSLPSPTDWQLFAGGQSDNTTVVDFVTNQVLRISTFGGTADEWSVGPLFDNETVAGARFRLVEFPSTGEMNLLGVTTVSAPLGPAPSITLVNGRYKLWNYVNNFGPPGDTEIMDIGPVVSNEWHTAYISARDDGHVKLWWDGLLVFDGLAPQYNFQDGFMEWGCGSWEYSAAVTAEYDWVGFGDASDQPAGPIGHHTAGH